METIFAAFLLFPHISSSPVRIRKKSPSRPNQKVFRTPPRNITGCVTGSRSRPVGRNPLLEVFLLPGRRYSLSLSLFFRVSTYFLFCACVFLLSSKNLHMQGTLRLLTDAIYDEFAAPNPYRPQRRVPYREYQQVVGDMVDSLEIPNFQPPPPEVLCVDVACQVPTIGAPSPISPRHSPIQPIRCASNTVGVVYDALVVLFFRTLCDQSISVIYDLSPFTPWWG